MIKLEFRKVKFIYKGLHNYDSHCYLYVNQNLVIATQDKDNDGTSITNMGRELALMISEKLCIPIEKMIYIEHYDANTSDNGEEIFWLIDLTSKNAIPEREILSREIVDAIDSVVCKETLNIRIKFK